VGHVALTQVTVFAGERILGTAGFENETMATCEETLMEFPAQSFMTDIIEAESEHVAFLQDPLDVEEYRKELLKIADKYGLI